MPRESKSSKRRIEATDRQRQALELRKAGATFEVIAQKLGYKGKSSAYRSVMAALRKTLQEPADEVRKLELERLDGLFSALWPRAKQGDEKATDRVLRIMARRAALLGLDAPVRTDVTSGGEPIAVSQHFEIALERAYDDSTGQLSENGSESGLPGATGAELPTG